MALNSQSFSLPFHLGSAVEGALETWRADDRLARLWGRDAALWTGNGEGAWLGWLDAPGRASAARYEAIGRYAREGGFPDLVLLGMGGSVLCPAVFAQVFGVRPPFPRLHVLDSVDPAQIRNLERSLDPGRTCFIVSSKSGSTLESGILMSHFIERVRREVAPADCGERFIAITDPGTPLERRAREVGFGRIYAGQPDIGGRFSAFSDFGLVPMAMMGVDVGRFIEATMPMVEASGPSASVAESPGVLLGVILGVLARAGRDKVSLVVSQSAAALGLWIEQLLAESTGKRGRGIIPVVGEVLHSPEHYGNDRVFVYLGFGPDPDREQEASIAALEESGQPVVRIGIRDADSIGQELFRWEIATAVVGAELGINPFDQPDVEASKIITRELMSEYEAKGAFPVESPVFRDDALSVFAAGRPGARDLAGCMSAFLGSVGPGDYIAILAYAPMEESAGAALEGLREVLGGGGRTATTLGFGPRYLHSSGQLHKGGPNTGAFLILVSEDAEDIPVPGHAHTFGAVKTAQARADARALVERGRRVLRIDVGGRFDAGVRRLVEAVS